MVAHEQRFESVPPFSGSVLSRRSLLGTAASLAGIVFLASCGIDSASVPSTTQTPMPKAASITFGNSHIEQDMAAALHLTPTQVQNQKVFAEPHVYNRITGKPYEYTNYIETGTARGGQETVNRAQFVGVSSATLTERANGNSQTYDKVVVVLRFQGADNVSFLAPLFYDPKGNIGLGMPVGQGIGELLGVSNSSGSYGGIAFGVPVEALVDATKGQPYDLDKELEFISHDASQFDGHYDIHIGDYMTIIFDVAGGSKTPMQTFMDDYINGDHQGNFEASRKAMQDKVGESAPVLIGATDPQAYVQQEFLRGAKNPDIWTTFARLYDLSGDAQEDDSDQGFVHIKDTIFPQGIGILPASASGQVILNGRKVLVIGPPTD